MNRRPDQGNHLLPVTRRAVTEAHAHAAQPDAAQPIIKGRRSSDHPTDGGKRVTYWGRTGDQHTEWFPGSEPDRPPLTK